MAVILPTLLEKKWLQKNTYLSIFTVVIAFFAMMAFLWLFEAFDSMRLAVDWMLST